MSAEPLLAVQDLAVAYETGAGTVAAVRGVSFALARGQRVGVVGESGCGKSALALALLGVLPRNGRVSGGSVRLAGRELVGGSSASLRAVRGTRMAMVFQDPMTSLNPVFTVGQQLDEVQRVHGGGDKAGRRVRAGELLARLGMPDPEARLDAYPHELSGGMRQRVMLAMALVNQPELIVADEPTTALDVTVQAQIAELLRAATDDDGMALLFISHDLRLVSELCHDVAVMYAGEIVESGAVAEVFARPRHPYTRALLRSLPDPTAPQQRLAAIPGAPPNLLDPPAGCPFYERCPDRVDRCRAQDPPLLDVGGDVRAACWVAADAVPASERTSVEAR